MVEPGTARTITLAAARITFVHRLLLIRLLATWLCLSSSDVQPEAQVSHGYCFFASGGSQWWLVTSNTGVSSTMFTMLNPTSRSEMVYN